ncbi:MAG: anaerobic sulfatase maturase [Syntrophaceae bacterium]|nr:anaerobic sulfatase maturase [Syntrophaceae bacterium]
MSMPRPQNAPPAFHLLAKPTGAACNLDCAYCFFLDKEALYPGSRFRMSDATLELYIRQLVESHRADTVNIAWQGGEPTLMGLDFYRRAMALAEKYRRPGMTYLHTLQTNGTLLNDEWAAFFKQHGFLIGISIDGPRDVHDVYRVDKIGRPTFDRVMRGLRLLQKHGVEYNVLTAVNGVNADYPLEVYRFLRDEAGATWMQFIPVVERVGADGPGVSERSVGPEQFGRFLCAVFDEWVRRDVGRIFVQTFEATLRNWLGMATSGMCVFNETCGTGPALEHNGDLYSCDHFVEPKHLLGNIHDGHMIEMVASARQLKFGRDKRDRLPRLCLECDVRFACHGECPKNRFVPTPDGEPGLNYLCAGLKAFFRHAGFAMQLMAGLMRRGRYARDVMPVLDRAFDGVLGHDPCPCGSGRAFAGCHGRPQAGPVRRTLPEPQARSAVKRHGPPGPRTG